jgi:hypothetical protein
MGDEGIYDFIDITFEYLFKFVKRKPDSVIGHTVLGKIVRPYLFTPVSGSYL